MVKLFILFFFVCFSAQSLQAQYSDSSSADTLRVKLLPEVVVTATRSQKSLQQVPSPMSIISADEIKRKGLVRLDEILAEKAGLTVQYDPHGEGVQIQGFDPAYTLILIDGLPLIGRSTGIFDLSRISTDNIEKIEIVKGPTSSLYGSEAMAGVINIITAQPVNGYSGNITGRYGTNNTANLSLNSAYKNDVFSLSGSVNRFSSKGYSLQPAATPTVSPYHNYAVNTKGTYRFSRKTDLSLGLRYYSGQQQSESLISDRLASGDGSEKDFNIAPLLTHRFNNQFTSTLQLYSTTYKTKSALFYKDNGDLYDDTYFNQALSRAELKNDYALSNKIRLTLGAGSQYESVEATRYTDKKVFHSGYGYFQGDWMPSKKLDVIFGGRYDAHSVYKSQFSPKISASYAISQKLTVLGSAGKGYKAPDFRQLYLNFTNAEVGYSVFGYEEAAVGLQKLQSEGQLSSILIDASSLKRLNAESSTAFNFGFRYTVNDRLSLTSNLFRNNIDNLIETAALAIKTNGQSVFSYFNLNKVYTQGIEAGAKYEPLKRLQLSAEIQYLEAFDQDVLNRIKQAQVYGRDPNTNVTTAVTRSNYGGLLNRSRYTANLGINHQWEKAGINTSLRAIWRGRYGYKDIDGNAILNLDEEYTKSYTLLNATVSKSLINKQFNLQIGVQNLLNYTNPNVILNLPGRLFYTGLTYNFNNN